MANSSYTSRGHHTAFGLLKDACPSGRLVVDVGAFPGTLTRMLAQRWRVIAMDKEPNRGLSIQAKFLAGDAIDGREETFAEAMQRIGVDTRAADVECVPLPLEDATVDAVVLTEVVEHLYVNPLLTLTEINRVLTDGGVMLVSTPNLLSIRNRFNFMRGEMGRVIQPPFHAFLQRIKIGHCGHVRLYAPDELQGLLRRLGFETEFRFYRFNFWDPAPGQTSAEVGTGSVTHPRSILRKLFRSPKNYLNAVVATARVLLETVCPQCRPHMFVLARKVKTVSLTDLAISQN